MKKLIAPLALGAAARRRRARHGPDHRFGLQVRADGSRDLFATRKCSPSATSSSARPRAVWPRPSNMSSSARVNPPPISWARKVPAPSSAACAMAKAPSITRTARSSGSTGRARRSASISAATARAAWCWSTTRTSPEDLYDRFGGVEGSAYMIGGVGVNFQQQREHHPRPHPHRRRRPAGRQCGLPEVFQAPQLEPFLTEQRSMPSTNRRNRGSCFGHDSSVVDVW